MSARQYGIGILGAARIAPPAVVAPAQAHKNLRLAGIAARDPARAAAFAAEHGIAAVFPDYAALIADPDIDLVYVALPPALHAEWTMRALEHGKAVLCEKPFATSVEEAHGMVAAAQRAGRPLIEAAHYRFHAMFREVERIVRQGELGRIVTANAWFDAPIAAGDWRWNVDQGGGALADLGFYPVHALRTLLGAEPQVRTAHARWRDGVDAAITAELRLGDASARIRAAMDAPKVSIGLELVGTAATLSFDRFVAPQLGGCLTIAGPDGVSVRKTEGPSTFAAQLDHVADILRGEATPLTGGSDAVANMEAMAAIRDKARETG